MCAWEFGRRVRQRKKRDYLEGAEKTTERGEGKAE